ncbi:MAG: hypothetical protein ACTH52_06595 [Lactococcus cremoris]
MTKYDDLYITRKEYEEYVDSLNYQGFDPVLINKVKADLNNLIGLQFSILNIPKSILLGFEPSQIGSIVGNLMDAGIPQITNMPTIKSFPDIGITKNIGIIGERESYPDFLHSSGVRLELKLIYVDNPEIKTKRPPTKREPSARLNQQVTYKNIIPEKDLLLVIAYSLKENNLSDEKQPIGKTYSPTIIDYDLFPVFECVYCRDKRMYDSSGGWFGNFETPTILSKSAKNNMKKFGGTYQIDYNIYGRKESEGRDFNVDTNFGKLKRIPHISLQRFLKKYSIN